LNSHSICACIGPLYDEPFCYCEMQRRGLPLNDLVREEKEKELRKALGEIFGWKVVSEESNNTTL